MRVDEQTITLDESPVFFRSGKAPEPPALFLHGIPTSSEDWVDLLARTGGIAPDLIGFGRSAKGGHLDYSLRGLADFIERLLDHLEVPRVKLVAHDWGAAAGLVFAQRQSQRIERIVLVNPLPLVPGYRYARLGRIWRRRAVGELVMGSVTKGLLARELRSASAEKTIWTSERVKLVWEHFDQGTQRAILRLHRATGEPQLAAAGEHLQDLAQPTLIVWGERDPWLDPSYATALRARLPSARLERIPDAGHWPWLDDSRAQQLIEDFLR